MRLPVKRGRARLARGLTDLMRASCPGKRNPCARPRAPASAAPDLVRPAAAPGDFPRPPVRLAFALADQQLRAPSIGQAQVEDDEVLALLRPPHHPATGPARRPGRRRGRRDVAELLILIGQLRTLRLPV